MILFYSFNVLVNVHVIKVFLRDNIISVGKWLRILTLLASVLKLTCLKRGSPKKRTLESTKNIDSVGPKM